MKLYKINGLENFIKFKIKKTKIFNRYFGEEKKYRTYGTLGDEQMRFINAFSGAIYPPSDNKERMKLHKVVFKWTKERTETDGYFKEYDEFVDIIKAKTKNKHTNYKFYESSPDEIIKLFKDLYKKTDLYDIPRTRNPVKLLKFIIHFMINRKKYYQNSILKTVRKDLINGIYSSELGYSLVDFNSISGVRGKYSDYTEPSERNNPKGKPRNIRPELHTQLN